jgi:DNA end-binding protein Ku
VQYKRVCSVDGAEVPYEEIGRGYVSTTGELVVLSDVDLAMLPAKTSRSIRSRLIPADGCHRCYLLRPQLLREPEPQAAKAYRLMRDALRKLGRIAVAKVTLRDREIIAVLRVHGDVLLLATMLWPDEVREPNFDFLAEDDEWLTPSQELAMAEALINSLSDEQLDPARYRDVHRETLTALVDAKASGRTVTTTEETAPSAAAPDLLSALRASIEAAKEGRSTGNGGRRRSTTPSGRSSATNKKVKKPAEKKPAETSREAPPEKRG